MKNIFSIRRSGERGSLALEQVLFIGAIVALSAGIYAFYNRLGTYFQTVNIPTVPTSTTTTNYVMFFSAKTPRKLRRRFQMLRSAPAVVAIVLAGASLIAARPLKAKEPETSRVQIVSEDDMVELPTPAQTLAKGESLKNIEF